MLSLKKLLTKLILTAPVGKIDMYAGASAPSGWLLCNGQAVSRVTYARLFNVIGTTYGAGNGSTTFNVPDMRDRFPVGAGNLYSRNSAGGSKDAIIPYHRHSVSAVTDGITGGGHTHEPSNTAKSFLVMNESGSGATRTNVQSGSNATQIVRSVDNAIERLATTNSTTHKHNLPAHNTAYVGTDGNITNANLPPYRGVNFIIYAGGGGLV